MYAKKKGPECLPPNSKEKKTRLSSIFKNSTNNILICLQEQTNKKTRNNRASPHYRLGYITASKNREIKQQPQNVRITASQQPVYSLRPY